MCERVQHHQVLVHVVERRWKGSNKDREKTTLEVEVDVDGFFVSWEQSLRFLLG